MNHRFINGSTQQKSAWCAELRGFWANHCRPVTPEVAPRFLSDQVDVIKTIKETSAERCLDYFGFYPKVSGQAVSAERLYVCPLKCFSRFTSFRFITEDLQETNLEGRSVRNCVWQTCQKENPDYVFIGVNVLDVLAFSQLKPMSNAIGAAILHRTNSASMSMHFRQLFPRATICLLANQSNDDGLSFFEAMKVTRAIGGKVQIYECPAPLSSWRRYYCSYTYRRPHEKNIASK